MQPGAGKLSPTQPADGEDGKTCAALLKLDLLTAKSSLAKLQLACTAANADHVRTKDLLHSLQQQYSSVQDCLQAGSDPHTPCDNRAAIRQLHALHQENLQLKASLKQEIEARQQLQRQHVQLLAVLRSPQVADLLAADQCDSVVQHEQDDHAHISSDPESQGKPSVDAARLSDQAHASTSATTCSIASNSGTAGMLHTAHITKSSRFTSSADGREGNTVRWRTSNPSAPAPSGSAEHEPCLQTGEISMPTHSAYFPAHHDQQQNQQQVQQEPRAPVGQQSNVSLQHRTALARACHEQQHAIAADSVAHSALRSGSCLYGTHSLLDEQDQQRKETQGFPAGHMGNDGQSSTPPCTAFSQQSAPVMFQHSPCGAHHQQACTNVQGLKDNVFPSVGLEADACVISSSTSSRSVHSEMLDSDDLDELAGLCDTLLQHHADSTQASSSAWASTPRTLLHGTPGHFDHARPQSRMHDAVHSFAGSSALNTQQCEDPVFSAGSGSGSQTGVPGLQALATQLRQLQEQVAATALDAGQARKGSSSFPGAASAHSTPSLDPGSTYTHPCHDAGRAGSLSGLAALSQSVSAMCGRQGGRQEAGRDTNHPAAPRSRAATLYSHNHVVSPSNKSCSGDRCGADDIQDNPYAGDRADSPAMVSLQHQLAQRMQEVKNRLSNICNGMLQEAAPSTDAGQQHVSGVRFDDSMGSPMLYSSSLNAGPSSMHNNPAGVSAGFAGSSTFGTGSKADAGGLQGAKMSTVGSLHRAAKPVPEAPAASIDVDSTDTCRSMCGLKTDSAASAKDNSSRQTYSADAAEAAFAAIKASINSTNNVAGARMKQCQAPAAASQSTSRSSKACPQPAQSRKSVLPPASTTSANSSTVSDAEVNTGAVVAKSVLKSIPQGSTAGGDEGAVAEDSEDSWSTVDGADLELQPGAAAGSTFAHEPGPMPHQHNAAEGTAMCDLGSDDNVHSSQLRYNLKTSMVHAPHACDIPHGAAQPASPVNGGMLAANLTARMPAEVVFSPLKVSLCESADPHSDCRAQML